MLYRWQPEIATCTYNTIFAGESFDTVHVLTVDHRNGIGHPSYHPGGRSGLEVDAIDSHTSANVKAIDAAEVGSMTIITVMFSVEGYLYTS